MSETELDENPRLREHAYVTNGRSLWQVLEVAGIDVVLENVRTGWRSRFRADEVSQMELVIPEITVPDCLPEEA